MCNAGSVGSKRFGWIKILHILKNRDHISGLINIRKLQCNDFILQGFSIFQDQIFTSSEYDKSNNNGDIRRDM